MKAQIKKTLFIGMSEIATTEDLARVVNCIGKKEICHFLPYMKAIQIDSDFDTDTGVIKWATEDGTFISEKGYHYHINCFIN